MRVLLTIGAYVLTAGVIVSGVAYGIGEVAARIPTRVADKQSAPVEKIGTGIRKLPPIMQMKVQGTEISASKTYAVPNYAEQARREARKGPQGETTTDRDMNRMSSRLNPDGLNAYGSAQSAPRPAAPDLHRVY